MTIKNEQALSAAFLELDYEENEVVAKVLEETKKHWESLSDTDLEKIVWGER